MLELLQSLEIKDLLIISVPMILILMVIIYLGVVLDSYLETGTKIKYGNYRVEIIDTNSNQIIKEMTIKAWNDVNAVERVGRRIRDTENKLFKSSKV